MSTHNRTIDNQAIDNLIAAARTTPRRRKNLNVHPSDESKAHRLLNAVEPDSYIRPHRHLDPEKDETFGWLRGSFLVLLFNDDGTIAESHRLAPDHALFVTIPSAAWHTIVSLETGSVFFEAKAGPYRPLQESEKAPWAPDENAPTTAAYLAALKKQPGDTP
jgi:cupin fold WbuC family metalloprotein